MNNIIENIPQEIRDEEPKKGKKPGLLQSKLGYCTPDQFTDWVIHDEDISCQWCKRPDGLMPAQKWIYLECDRINKANNYDKARVKVKPITLVLKSSKRVKTFKYCIVIDGYKPTAEFYSHL